MNRKASQNPLPLSISPPPILKAEVTTSKRNRELRNAVIAVLAAAAMSPAVVQRAEAAPTVCTPNGGDPTDVNCTGDQSQGVHSTRDFDPNVVDTVNVRNLTTNIQAPSLPAANIGVKYELFGPYGNGGIHDVTLNVTGTAGTPIRVTTNGASAVSVETLAGPAYDGRGASSGFLCAGAHSADEGAVGPTGNLLTVNLSNLNLTSFGVNAYGLRAANSAGNGGYGGGGSMCYSSEAGGVGGHGGTLVVTGMNASIATVGDSAIGISASSAGGNGGHGGDGGSFRYGSRGGIGGVGGEVRLSGTGTITTNGDKAVGIYSVSVGGNGGDGGSSDGFGGGGNGPYGAGGGLVHIDSGYDVTTQGANSYGIAGYSLGGHGGNGGDGTFFNPSSGNGGGSGQSGDVWLKSTGNISTSGINSHGIVAQSIAGYAGSGGTSNSVVNFGSSGGSAGKGGRVDVFNEGTITTTNRESHAIFAESIGGGGGSGGGGFGAFYAAGGVGGSGGNGGMVFVTNSSTGTLRATGLDSRGIFAQSIGGAGGDGGDSIGIAALGGAGADTSDGDRVSVINSGSILSASHAIYAESIGGGGGNGGDSTGWFSVGGGGGAGGKGGVVFVENHGSLTTRQDSASAIFAHSIGGGGGNGGSSISAGLGISFAIGGKGANGGDGESVTVHSDTGSILTGANFASGDMGNGSHGIYAQSVGGGGGNGGFAFSGSVGAGASLAVGLGGKGGGGGAGKAVEVLSGNTITTHGDDANAIFAESLGGGGGSGGFAIAVTGSQGLSGALAVGGEGGKGGASDTVKVASSGTNLQTFGDRSAGILAQSVGGGGGNGGFAIAGAFSFSITPTGTAAVALGGTGGGGGGAKEVTVDSSSNIATSGDDSHGLFAQSVGGGGGNGGFAIGASITTGAAVNASFGGSGAAGGVGGVVNVGKNAYTTGTIHTRGDHSSGLFAQSVGGGGGNGGFSVAGGISGAPSANFSVGGSGGTARNSDAVTVRTANTVITEGNDSHGIVAQSVGGGGGEGGFSVAGAITASGAVTAGLGGSGGGGGSANTVTLTNIGTSVETNGTHSYGVFAQSVGGGGGDGGFAIAGTLSQGPSASFGLGGSGSGAGIGRDVFVTSTSAIITRGDEAHGLFAQSVGGGGGSGGFAVAGSMSASGGSLGAAIGGSGDGGGTGGRVFLNTIADDTGAISTSGNHATGILAQSVGGGGGNGGFAIGANVTNGPSASLSLGGNGGTGSDSDIVFVNSGSTVSTRGNDSHGIFAQSVGGGGGDGGFAVAGSISATGNVNAALGGTGNGGGSAKTVTLLSSGDFISTLGFHSYGIVAQSLGGGGGDGGFSVGAGISDGATANLAIGGNGAGGGFGRAVYLDSSTIVSTQGNDAHGVFAQSVGGGGGSGGFSVVGGISKANAGASLGGKGAGGGDGGNVTLKNTASSISTGGDHAYGVIAQSIGGGGGDGGFSVAGGLSSNGSASLALGGEGDGGGNGKIVNLTSSSNVTTRGNDAHGLFAQSVGGGGGSGGFAVSGAISNNGAATAALGGKGDGGGSADAVTLFNSGSAIDTFGARSYGVVAQSVGGGGGDGGFAVTGSITKGPAANFSMGGSGAGGGSSNNVTLNSSSAVTTRGQDAHAIFAQSVGGGGGSGGFSVSGSISADSGTVSASIGGSGDSGGNAGKVSLGTVSAIDGMLTTIGDRAYGILAQSVGGGGGDGGFSVAAGISKGSGAKFSMGGSGGSGGNSDAVSVRSAATINTIGAESHGIFAQSIGGGGGSGGFSVAGSISTEGSSVNASIGGSGDSGGDGKAVDVTSLGASIETVGARAYGIVAQSIGGGGGDGGFSVAGSINKQKTINFSLGGSGDVGGKSDIATVLSSTNITTHGDESHGIFAQSLGGGGGSGGFSVTGSLFASTTNAPSIDASIGGSGAGGGDAGAVSVGTTTNFVSGIIDTSGVGAHGIFAQSLGGGGGNGGFSVAGGLNKSPAIRFSLGGSAGTGSDADKVNVYTAANIITRGDEGHGVFAQSLGGGGGNGGFSIVGSATTDTTSVNASIGGKGGGGGIGADVGVITSGNITTLGDNSFGVFAQSIGGGGGNGGFSIAGSLTAPPSGAVTKKPANNLEFSMGGDGGNGDRGGNVTVANSGLINTFGESSHGILAHSVGGGGGSGGLSGTGTLSFLGAKSSATRATMAVSIGGDGGSGDIGGDVRVTNTRSIYTEGGDARGIYAYSVGGGGGNGGASYAIDLSLGKTKDSNGFNFELAVGGKGGTGNISGAVNVNSSGGITTLGDRADAILAQSIGGGGGNGGKSHAASFDFTREAKPPSTEKGSEPWNFTTSIGGNGGTANDGGLVSVTNTGNIDTSGISARGIVAQSVGGGGGTGGDGIQGTGVDAIDTGTEILDLRDKNFLKNLFDLRSWTITVGGSGGASGEGKDVDVTNSGSIVTRGLSSHAIFAQSIGGGGGEAQNFAKGTGNAGTAASGINSKFALGGGGGASGNGGKVTIVNTNSIVTFGDEAHGIFAQSIGGGGGVAGNVDRGFSSSTTIPGVGTIPKLNIGVGFAVGQDGGGGGNGGDVTVTNTGLIRTAGNGAFGILAQSIGGGGGAAGGLGNDGTFLAPVLGLQNFYGSAGGAGDAGIVTVTQTGNVNVTGGNSIGIFAQSTTNAGVSKAVNITTNGDVNAVGVGSFGVLAQSLGKQSTDQLLSSDNITVTVNGGSIRGGVGLPPAGAVSLALTENERGAAINFRDGKDNSLVNRGTVGDRTDLSRMAVLGEIGNETINNFGTVVGNINLGAGRNTLTNNANASLISGATINLSTTGTLTNSGTWSVGNQNSIASTALTGNVRQTVTGRLLVDLDHITATADRVSVLNNGAASLAGSVVLNQMNLTAIKPGTHHLVLLSAAGGVDTTGLTLAVDRSAVTQYQLSGGGSSQLLLDMTTDFSLAASGVMLSPNQAAVGGYINDVQSANSSTAFAPLIARLVGLEKSTDIATIYEQLVPDGYAALTSSTMQNGLQFGKALLSCKMRDGDYHFTREGQCGWFGFTFNQQSQDGTSSANGFDRDGRALAGGMQIAVSDHWHMGLGVSFNTDSITATDPISGFSQFQNRSQGTALQSGAVIKGNYGNFTLAASYAGSHGEYDASRRTFDGALASSEQLINSTNFQLRGAYAFDFKRWYLRPLVDVNFADIHRGGFSETGTSAYNLVVQSSSSSFVAVQPQIEGGYDVPMNEGNLARWYARLGMTRIVSGEPVDVTASLVNAPAGVTPFTVSQSVDKTFTDVAVGIDLFSAEGVVLRVGYVGQFSNNSSSSGGSIKISLPF